MASSKDSSEVSTSNIIKLTWETLSAEEQLLFEERQEQLIQEAKAKFLADFKVDRNNKVVRQRTTDLASLRPTTNTPNVSSTNELQSLKDYIDKQWEQMQRIVGDIQNDHKRLVRALDKSTIANLPSHEVELREYTRNSSTTGCHDQSQSLYGMPIDMYLGQQQPPTHISDKFADLRMSGPSARERGPSGPARGRAHF
jgi:restriction endonuclease